MNKTTYRLISILGLLILLLAWQTHIMDEVKVYTPTVIKEEPFPGDLTDAIIGGSSQPSASGVYSPAKITDQTFPTKKVATQLISDALNTQSRKILKDIGFTKSGALQIGEYTNGVQGDIRISPLGIVARDAAGNNTFSLDGETGDATFRGTVQARDFVIADELGLNSLNNFASGYVDNLNVFTITPGGVYTEIATGGTGDPLVVSFVLDRRSNVLVFFNASGRCTVDGGFQLVALYRDDGNGVAPFTQLTGNARISGAINGTAGAMQISTTSQAKILTLEAGRHRIAMRHRSAGANSCIIQDMTIGYMVLGR